MKRQIPNILTLLNLFSGCVACVMALNNEFLLVFVWIIIASVFDFFDGFAARLLKVSSPLGVQLDSLADVVSFGVAPAMAVFALLNQYIYLLPSHSCVLGLLPCSTLQLLIPYSAFLLPMFAAYRLGKFNIDERQTTSFLGLPTPANGLFWVSYVYGMQHVEGNIQWLIVRVLLLVFFFSWLMVSEIPMFSLKLKEFKVKGNERQLILIVLGLLLIGVWELVGVAYLILAYIVISILTMRKNKTIR